MEWSLINPVVAARGHQDLPPTEPRIVSEVLETEMHRDTVVDLIVRVRIVEIHGGIVIVIDATVMTDTGVDSCNYISERRSPKIYARSMGNATCITNWSI